MVNYSAFHWSEKARKYAETIGTIFNVKGRVNTFADLPSTGNKVGDLYLVGLPTDADLIEYAWLSFDNVTRWEKLGSTAISTSFSALTGSPNDNVALKNALDGKYSTSNPDGYISGITSTMVTIALGYTPQQQLESGTNIKTINNNSILGSGNLTLDGLPSQTGKSGKFLTTDGTDASWGTIPSDSTKANTSLSNLDSTGQDVIDGKVDLNAANLSTAGKSLISGLGMPSNRYIDLTLGASGTQYTAPANGWFECGCTGTVGSTYFELVAPGSSATASYTGGWARASIPVRKGDVMTVYYGGNNFTKQFFLFMYAEGEENV